MAWFSLKSSQTLQILDVISFVWILKTHVNCFFFQWFGNIVTMDWWDDLWLNEGFASFFEYIGVEEAESDWGMVSSPSKPKQICPKHHFEDFRTLKLPFVLLWHAARHHDHQWCASCHGGRRPPLLSPNHCECVDPCRDHLCFRFHLIQQGTTTGKPHTVEVSI